MELIKLNLTSKKTGKPFIAYAFQVGDFRSPIFFLSPIELKYLLDVLGQTEATVHDNN